MKKRFKRPFFWLLLAFCLSVFYVGTGYFRSLFLESSYQVVELEHSGRSGIVRLVQLSDLHRAEFGPDNQDLVALVSSKKPDVIVCTGDMIDVRTQDYSQCVSLLRNLCRIAPVYYSLGNHEVDRADLPQFLTALERVGVHVLDDEVQRLNVNGVTLKIAGCYRANALPYLLQKSEIDILLCHFPQDFSYYAACNIPLTFSGHTHGGQFRIPLLDIALYAPGQGWFADYTTGLYLQDGSAMIVSRGLGNSSFPFRVHNPPEIVVTDLVLTP